MPAAMFLLFLAIPAFAALSFEIKDFLLFMVLFCLAAGLSTASSDSATVKETSRDSDGERPQSQSNAAKASHAGGLRSSSEQHSSRARTLPRLS